VDKGGIFKVGGERGKGKKERGTEGTLEKKEERVVFEKKGTNTEKEKHYWGTTTPVTGRGGARKRVPTLG